MKTEPTEFSIHDFQEHPQCTAPWDGVRNYQARNYLKTMKPGDIVFIYHSNVKNRGIVGTATVVSKAVPDQTAHDPQSNYYDSRSTPENPRWVQIDFRLQTVFIEPLLLTTLKQQPELYDMPLLKRGQRLSVQPVSHHHAHIIFGLANIADN
ncbi:EVE domain-containing protein [Desulfurispira natronophila]|uniref:Putative RNA-binding protein with PUA-like domain n=1 Tax=Desulfurispira natronophila TaxID=682562 RepID=A0A7W8DHX0_9BACT|nr:putative RNA-binding protein with PUA-like domain [Desulfurispira natronophila]